MPRLIILFVLAGSVWAQAQTDIVISASAIFNEEGILFRGYGNREGTEVPASDLIADTGGPHLWDFSTGPTNEVYRFDYVPVTTENHGDDFPNATVVERKTTEGTGEQAWLFLENVTGVGRRVHGFYRDASDFGFGGSVLFDPPITDFPSQIRLGDRWSASTSYETEILDVPAIIRRHSNMEADAFGVIDLPGLGFGDVLRLNELVRTEVEVDLFGEGTFQNVATEFIRNYYWMRPGYGLVAQLTSKSAASEVPDRFNTASFFIRMFQTNKTPEAPCQLPAPVTDLRATLDISAGQITQVLLKWTKTDCTGSYKVEISGNPADPDSWVALGTTTSAFMIDKELRGVQRRFYRVQSLK